MAKIIGSRTDEEQGCVVRMAAMFPGLYGNQAPAMGKDPRL